MNSIGRMTVPWLDGRLEAWSGYDIRDVQFSVHNK